MIAERSLRRLSQREMMRWRRGRDIDDGSRCGDESDKLPAGLRNQRRLTVTPSGRREDRTCVSIPRHRWHDLCGPFTLVTVRLHVTDRIHC